MFPLALVDNDSHNYWKIYLDLDEEIYFFFVLFTFLEEQKQTASFNTGERFRLLERFFTSGLRHIFWNIILLIYTQDESFEPYPLGFFKKDLLFMSMGNSLLTMAFGQIVLFIEHIDFGKSENISKQITSY